MPLPEFDRNGDLPVAVHRASLGEVIERFGKGTARRRTVTTRLLRVIEIAASTRKLSSVVLFGSYVTAEPNPRDVDLVLIFHDDFIPSWYDLNQRRILDHRRAERDLGASVFWIRPSLLFLQTIDEFVEGWQVKRDGTRRGIVEVIS